MNQQEILCHQELSRELRLSIVNSMQRHGTQELDSVAKDLLELIVEGISMVDEDTITAIEGKVDDLAYQVDSVRSDLYDKIEDTIADKFKKISQQLKDMENLSSYKEKIELKADSVTRTQNKLMLELQKVREALVTFAEFIDPPKKINFRKEPDKTPRIVSKALSTIVNNLENP